MKIYAIFLCLDIILILYMAVALWLNNNVFLLLVTVFTCLLQFVEMVRIQKRLYKQSIAQEK